MRDPACFLSRPNKNNSSQSAKLQDISLLSRVSVLFRILVPIFVNEFFTSRNKKRRPHIFHPKRKDERPHHMSTTKGPHTSTNHLDIGATANNKNHALDEKKAFRRTKCWEQQKAALRPPFLSPVGRGIDGHVFALLTTRIACGISRRHHYSLSRRGLEESTTRVNETCFCTSRDD